MTRSLLWVGSSGRLRRAGLVTAGVGLVMLAGLRVIGLAERTWHELRVVRVMVAGSGAVRERAQEALRGPSSVEGANMALLMVATRGSEAIAEAVGLLDALGDGADGRRIGIRVQRQAERWARAGAEEPSLAAFGLLWRLDNEFPEPFVRMGEYCYAGGRIGISCSDAFERAISSAAQTPRDGAFKSIAHMRLCEAALGRARPIEAETHCRAAIRLDTYGVYTTWHTPAAHALLGSALATQGRYQEAKVAFDRAREIAPSSDYRAGAWYRLAAEVYEPLEQWDEAFTAYRAAATEGSVAWVEEAGRALVRLCSERSLPNCP